MEKQLTNFQKAILKDYPAFDSNRHYWKEGDVLELSGDYTILCIENKGFEKDSWVVISGFNKGCILDIDLDKLPYMSKEEYKLINMSERLKKYCVPSSKLVYELGDVVLHKDRWLICITKLCEDRNYHAFVVEEYNSTFYKNSTVVLYNDYKQFMV